MDVMGLKGSAEYRWFRALCEAWGIDPMDKDWVEWAANEWSSWACRRGGPGRFREFKLEFEGRAQGQRFKQDAAREARPTPN